MIKKALLKGVKISDNLLELIAIIDYCKKENIPAYIMFIDFESAFDMVEWSALKVILKSLNFGDKFIEMIFICLENFSNSIMNDGVRSSFFGISRGFKQGCPLSPYLFDLVVEIIALKIRQNKDIKGININNIKKFSLPVRG